MVSDRVFTCVFLMTWSFHWSKRFWLSDLEIWSTLKNN
jgi:hypothetical protein